MVFISLSQPKHNIVSVERFLESQIYEKFIKKNGQSIIFGILYLTNRRNKKKNPQRDIRRDEPSCNDNIFENKTSKVKKTLEFNPFIDMCT